MQNIENSRKEKRSDNKEWERYITTHFPQHPEETFSSSTNADCLRGEATEGEVTVIAGLFFRNSFCMSFADTGGISDSDGLGLLYRENGAGDDARGIGNAVSIGFGDGGLMETSGEAAGSGNSSSSRTPNSCISNMSPFDRLAPRTLLGSYPKVPGAGGGTNWAGAFFGVLIIVMSLSDSPFARRIFLATVGKTTSSQFPDRGMVSFCDHGGIASARDGA